MRNYLGLMLTLLLGLIVELTVGFLGLKWWYLVAIGIAVVVIAWLQYPRRKPAPPSAVFDGDLKNNLVRGRIDTDADAVHRGRGEGNRWFGDITQRRPR